MAGYNGFYNQNQNMINQLLRQKDSIDNMINQYSQPPVQNIINTGTPLDFEARILKDDEDVDNIFINKRTMFLDKKNKKVVVKEIDGKKSEEYEIILPLDEKDQKIIELEKRLKEMEVRLNEHTEYAKPSNGIKQSYANDDEHVKSSTETNGRAISESVERTASTTNSTDLQREWD